MPHLSNLFLIFALILCSSSQCRFINSLYHTNEEIDSIFKNLAENSECSSILSAFNETDKETGNSTKYYVINSNKGNTKKNKIVLVFGEHSREIISPELAIYLVRNLCSIKTKEKSIYSKETIKAILDQNELLLVPLVNEYGRAQVIKGNLCVRENEHNADLNRNYPNHWKSSFINFTEDNPGQFPFSEWQTRNLNKIVKSFKPTVYITTHSGIFAMFMPYGYQKLSIDNYDDRMKTMKDILSKLNDKYCHCMSGSLSDKLTYPVNGNSIDYMYETLNIKYAFSFEIFNGRNENKYFNKLFESKTDNVFDINRFNSKSFLQIGSSKLKRITYASNPRDSCFISKRQEKVDDMFKECTMNMNPITKVQYDKTLINWTNVYFELFSLIYRKENNLS